MSEPWADPVIYPAPAPGFHERLGNCYQLAAQAAMDILMNGHEAWLVHGTIQADDLPPVDHAWIEQPNGEVYEPVLDIDFTEASWRALFHPVVHHRYSMQEVCPHMVDHGNYGPWPEEVGT